MLVHWFGLDQLTCRPGTSVQAPGLLLGNETSYFGGPEGGRGDETGVCFPLGSPCLHSVAVSMAFGPRVLSTVSQL